MPKSDLRAEVGASRRRQGFLWALVITGLLSLLSIFSGGLFLYAAAVTGVALALSLVLTTVSLGHLEVVRRISNTEIAYGEAVDAWLLVHNRGSLPALWLYWRDQIEDGLDVEGPTSCFRSLAAGAKLKLAYRLHSARRGLFRVGPAMVEASGPFGLVRRFSIGREARFITVLPRAYAIGRGWPLGHRPIHQVPRRRSLFEDPSRFQGIREYRRGDPLRRIHWRATARSGELQVKLFEPAVLEGLFLAVEMGPGSYPGSGAASEELVELAVSAAASLGEYVLAGGQAVGLLANGADAAERYPADWTGGTFRRLEEALAATGSRRKIVGHRPVELEPARGAWQLDRLRTVLARLVRAPGPSLAELLVAEIPRLPRSLVLMAVTPKVDAELAHALGSLRRSGIEAGVVWIRPLKTADAGDGPTDEGDAAALLEGAPVYVVRGETDLEALGNQRL